MENSQSRSRNFEVIFYCLALLLALGLRFIKLGALPLGDLEATNALQAAKIASGETVTVGGQPGYVILTSILFFIFGKTEFWARFWPALFGTALIFMPLFFQKWLGKIPALMLALFFAIVPGFVSLSRTATGTMIGLVSLCAALGFLVNHKTVPAGIFGGIALLGGISFWPGLLGILLSLGIYRLGFKKRTETIADPTEIDWKKFLFALGGTLILLGTVFLLRPFAFSGLGTSIADYFWTWGQTGTDASLKVMLIGLLSGQLLGILLALWGTIAGRKKYPGLNSFLEIWVLVSAVLTLLNSSQQIVDWIWTLLPLWVLAAIGAEDLCQYFSAKEWLLKLFQTIFTCALLVFSYLNFLSFVIGTPAASSTKGISILGIFLPLALLIVITLLVGWGWSPNAARQGVLTGVGLILLTVTFGTAWKSAGLGPRPETELWRSDALPVGRDLMLKSVNDLSLWNTGQKEGIDIVLLNANQPSFQWALRGISDLKQADILGNSETPSLIISSANEAFNLQEIYRGQSIVWTAIPDFEHLTIQDWLKWYAFRRVQLIDNNCFLWARTDLFKGS